MNNLKLTKYGRKDSDFVAINIKQFAKDADFGEFFLINGQLLEVKRKDTRIIVKDHELRQKVNAATKEKPHTADIMRINEVISMFRNGMIKHLEGYYSPFFHEELGTAIDTNVEDQLAEDDAIEFVDNYSVIGIRGDLIFFKIDYPSPRGSNHNVDLEVIYNIRTGSIEEYRFAGRSTGQETTAQTNLNQFLR